MPIPPRSRALAILPTALLLLGLAAGCRRGEAPVETEPAEPPRQVERYSITDFLDTTSYFGASFSPDGSKVLVTSDETGIFNAFAIPVDGGAPEQLTTSATDSIRAVGYFPRDERLLVLSNRGGDELDHLYVRELDGTLRDLTPGEGLKAVFYEWARDDTAFFYGTNERDERYFDVYEMSLDGYQRRLLYQNDEGYAPRTVSSDRRYLAFQKINDNADSDVYLLDRESGEMTHLTPHEGQANHVPETFSPDGTSLYLTTDAGHEFSYLVRHDLASGEREVVERPDWDVLYASFSRRGEHLLVAVNADARTELRLYRAESGERVPLPEVPGADLSSLTLSPEEDAIAFYASSSRLPGDLFYAPLGGEARQLTRSLSPEIDPRDLVEGEVVRFESFDGLEVPGILYRPHGASAEAPVPALVWVHGGPGGQSRIGYSAMLQYLVNHGYGVFAINNRGSSGYGKTFFHLDDRDHGQGDLGDCVASKEMLVASGWVDPERIGILGGSYGGYMVLAALTFRPEEFAVGVDLFGISNWWRTFQNIPPWWEAMRKYWAAEMGPLDDETYLRSISPLFHAEKIARPLMVLQGANDPRVLQQESDDIVAAARANGVPVEYLVFEDEGHGFVKKENREEGYEAILRFLDQHLKGEEEEQEEALDQAA